MKAGRIGPIRGIAQIRERLRQDPGCKIWLWVTAGRLPTHRRAGTISAARAELGIVGVKIDFPEPTNHVWSTGTRDAARDAAKRTICCRFSRSHQTYGMERTWPERTYP